MDYLNEEDVNRMSVLYNQYKKIEIVTGSRYLKDLKAGYDGAHLSHKTQKVEARKPRVKGHS